MPAWTFILALCAEAACLAALTFLSHHVDRRRTAVLQLLRVLWFVLTGAVALTLVLTLWDLVA